MSMHWHFDHMKKRMQFDILLYQTISSGSDELHKRELLAALNRILMNSNDIMMMCQMTGVDPSIEEH